MIHPAGTAAFSRLFTGSTGAPAPENRDAREFDGAAAARRAGGRPQDRGSGRPRPGT